MAISGVGMGPGTIQVRGLARTPGVNLGSANTRTLHTLSCGHLAKPEPLWQFLDIETCVRGECASGSLFHLAVPLAEGGDPRPGLHVHPQCFARSGLQVISCNLHREEAYSFPRMNEVFIHFYIFVL